MLDFEFSCKKDLVAEVGLLYPDRVVPLHMGEWTIMMYRTDPRFLFRQMSIGL